MTRNVIGYETSKVGLRERQSPSRDINQAKEENPNVFVDYLKSEPLAWEAGGNLVIAFFQTWFSILFKPSKAFASPMAGGWHKPLVFAMLVLILGTGIEHLLSLFNLRLYPEVPA
jgi:hypothetical protein